MAYRESDQAQLVEYLIEQWRRLPNVLYLHELMRKAEEFHRVVPVYPGIIRSCLSRIFRSADNTVKTGLNMIIGTDSKVFLGRLSSKNSLEITLEDVTVLEHHDQISLPLTAIVSETVIDEEVLRREWPSFQVHED